MAPERAQAICRQTAPGLRRTTPRRRSRRRSARFRQAFEAEAGPWGRRHKLSQAKVQRRLRPRRLCKRRLPPNIEFTSDGQAPARALRQPVGPRSRLRPSALAADSRCGRPRRVRVAIAAGRVGAALIPGCDQCRRACGHDNQKSDRLHTHGESFGASPPADTCRLTFNYR